MSKLNFAAFEIKMIWTNNVHPQFGTYYMQNKPLVWLAWNIITSLLFKFPLDKETLCMFLWHNIEDQLIDMQHTAEHTQKRKTHESQGADQYAPSGWAIFCMALGAIMIGMEILKPKTVVAMSIWLTSIRIRGRNLNNQTTEIINTLWSKSNNKNNKRAAYRILVNATSFSRRVHWSSAPEA